MNELQQFLLDNKGCPSTPAATKQLLVKFIELMSEQSGGTQFYRHQLQLLYTKSGVSYKCLLNIICTKSTNFQDLNELKGHYNGLYVGAHSTNSISNVDLNNGVFALVSISDNNVAVGDGGVSYTVTSISSDTVTQL